MKKILAITASAALLLTVNGCAVESSTGTTPAATSSPTRTMSSDYETFDSVAALTKKSTLVVKGHVTTEQTNLDEQSVNGGTQDDKIPSLGRMVVVDTVYKGADVKKLWVIKPDPSRVVMEGVTQLTPNQDVVLFLSQEFGRKDGVGIHDTWGQDQGYVSLISQADKVHPQGQELSVPLPDTLAELEAQIRAAA